MKAQVKYLIRKAYMNLRYQWWKAKIFSTPNDPRITKLVKNDIYHHELMSAACVRLDRLTPNDVKNDGNTGYRTAVIFDDWPTRPGLVDPENRYTKRKEN